MADKNAVREGETDKKQAAIEARAALEIGIRRDRGDIDEADDAPYSVSIEGDYINVIVGRSSFQFNMNEPMGDDIESDLEKASKAAKKKGK